MFWKKESRSTTRYCGWHWQQSARWYNRCRNPNGVLWVFSLLLQLVSNVDSRAEHEWPGHCDEFLTDRYRIAGRFAETGSKNFCLLASLVYCIFKKGPSECTFIPDKESNAAIRHGTCSGDSIQNFTESSRFLNCNLD